MRVLALDTTTVDGSIAIVEDDRVMVERRGDPSRSHAERLPNDMRMTLAAVGLTSADVDLFAVVAGPGSFTGLRIGIAAIQGLALVHGRRLVAVSALDALGMAAAIDMPAGALVAAWMDAHRHEVFSTLYRVGAAAPFDPERLTSVEAPVACRPDAALARWEAVQTTPSIIAGDGAILYADVIGSIGRVLPHPLLAPIAGRMALARAARGQTIDPAGVQPIYVRRPDVELTRDAKRAADTAAAGPGTATRS